MATTTVSRTRTPTEPPPDPVESAKELLRSAGYEFRKKHRDRSFTHFMRCVLEGDHRTLEKAYNSTRQSVTYAKAALNSSSGAAGGYTVPLEYTARLMNVIAEDSFIYPRATVIPMATGQMTCPKLNVESAPAGVGITPFFGGTRFKWGNEQAPDETEPTFTNLQLRSWDLLGYAVASNQWLMDMGPEGEEYLLNAFGKAAAWYAEFAFINGTGSAQQMPLGILSADATKYVPRTTGLRILIQDVANMAATLMPHSWKHAIWAISPSALAQIVQIPQYFTNSPAVRVAINAATGKSEMSLNSSQCGYLLTRPVFVTEKLPALGTSGDLILFDPSLYVIGDRQEVLIDVSDQSHFRTYQTDFRIWLRMDGKPQLANPVTLQDTATVVSPYVALNA